MKEIVAQWIQVIFGFRKFLLMLAILVVGVAFRIKGLVNGTEMVDLLKATTISFFAANGLEHLAGVAKDFVAAKVSGQAQPVNQEAEDAKEEAAQ